MPDKITGAITNGKRLALLQGSGMYAVEDNGGEPNTWPMLHLAGVGTSEPFVEHISGELVELLDASSVHDPQRQAVKDAISTILIDGLIPAFEHLKRIRASTGETMPLVNRLQLFDDFSRQLWYAYKELMPKAAMLLGFDLGFLFQKETNFETGIIAFGAAHPSLIADIDDYLRRQRKSWQNGLADFRNQFLEHRQADRERFAAYYKAETAASLFKAVWEVIVNLLAVFIESHMRGAFSIEQVPADQRDPNHPRLFRYVWVGPARSSDHGPKAQE